VSRDTLWPPALKASFLYLLQATPGPTLIPHALPQPHPSGNDDTFNDMEREFEVLKSL
jgi:hypothetical protein